MTGGLEVEELSAGHGTKPVLEQLWLAVREQGLACVVGASGCGKTTLLRSIAGFHRPSGGQIRLGGRILDGRSVHVPAERRRVGFIPQNVALFPHLSVAENIGFGLPRRERAARIRELLDLIDLAGHQDRQPHQLSGGQQQRVALARALAPRPELLLLDEPFSALDATLRGQVRADVARLLQATGTTAILVTHDADEALAFGDQITVLDAGRVLQTGTTRQVYDYPVDAVVARALGEVNVLSATIEGGSAMTALGPVQLTPTAVGTPTAEVLVRPERILIQDQTSPAGVRAEVTQCRFQGADHRLELSVPGCPGPVIARSVEAFLETSSAWLTVTGPVQPVGTPPDRAGR